MRGCLGLWFNNKRQVNEGDVVVGDSADALAVAQSDVVAACEVDIELFV
jgi:hypothetical protein